MTVNHYLWVEKYRPQNIEECILPETLKKTFKEFIASGELPNFIFSGTAGTGKTTAAKALCNEIGAEYILINGSDEGRSIDTLRTTIKGFASTVSLTEAKKVVIIDEADYMNADSVQPALRSFIEEFAGNCRFIFTCNFKHRLLDALQSRCVNIEFKIDTADKPKIASAFFRRVSDILKTEQVEFDQKVVAELITKHFPDYRRILNELQRYAVSGRIDTGILLNVSDESFKELFGLLKDKKFIEIRKWVGKNADLGTAHIFRGVYDKASDSMDLSSIPQLVVTLADYQYKSAFVADQEINLMAALTEIMVQCKFK
jgi:DNA polymerase III delta prime subunit